MPLLSVWTVFHQNLKLLFFFGSSFSIELIPSIHAFFLPPPIYCRLQRRRHLQSAANPMPPQSLWRARTSLSKKMLGEDLLLFLVYFFGFIANGATLLWSSFPATHYGTLMQPTPVYNATSPLHHEVRTMMRIRGGHFLQPGA